MTTIVEVRRIRELKAQGVERGTIAARLDVSPRTVSDAVSGKLEGRPLAPREAAAELDAEGWEPLCMDAAEWQDWRGLNPRITDRASAAWPCTDCPLGFAADMRAVGRCNGEPGAIVPVRFGGRVLHDQLVDELEEPDEPTPREEPNMSLRTPPTPEQLAVVERTRPFVEARDRALYPAPPPRQRPKVVASSMVVEPPCARCVKRDVCRIRVELEGLTPEIIGLPQGLSPAGTIAVDCEYFLEERQPRQDPLAAARSRGGQAAKLVSQRVDDDQLAAALRRHAGDQSAAARELGISSQAVSARLRWARKRGEAKLVEASTVVPA